MYYYYKLFHLLNSVIENCSLLGTTLTFNKKINFLLNKKFQDLFLIGHYTFKTDIRFY